MIALQRGALLDADPFLRERIRGFAAVISKDTGIRVDAILGDRRFPRVVKARNRLMLCLWNARLSLKEIGLVLGMHHTSVMHGLRNELGDAYQGEILSRYPASRRGSYRGEVLA